MITAALPNRRVYDPANLNPQLWDVINWQHKDRAIEFVLTPLELMDWATNLGYDVKIHPDGDQVELMAGDVLDYVAVPQHEDTFDLWRRM